MGPVRDDFREVVDLAKPLYGWVVESMSTRALRATLEQAGVPIDPEWKQIKLLRTVLITVGGMSETEARQAVMGLVVLNDLRVAAAHALIDKLEDAYRRLGQPGVPPTPRAAWDVLVGPVGAGYSVWRPSWHDLPLPASRRCAAYPAERLVLDPAVRDVAAGPYLGDSDGSLSSALPISTFPACSTRTSRGLDAATAS